MNESKWPTVYRLEDRSNIDGVDFWDFLSKENAEKFIHEDMVPHIRELSEKELQDTATMLYLDHIKDEDEH